MANHARFAIIILLYISTCNLCLFLGYWLKTFVYLTICMVILHCFNYYILKNFGHLDRISPFHLVLFQNRLHYS